MSVLWASRGRSWGFRFLLDGGYTDPLPTYERAFAGTEGQSTLCRRVGVDVALRFPDPLGRRDKSGRVIPHDVVVPPPLANQVRNVEDGLRLVWPVLADEYARLWDGPLPAEPERPVGDGTVGDPHRDRAGGASGERGDESEAD